MNRLSRAARWLHCKPWELLERIDMGEEFWLDMAIDFESAEITAHNERQAQAALRAKMGLG